MKVILNIEPSTNKKQLQCLLRKINFLRRFISNISGKKKVFSPLLHLKKEEGFRWEAEHKKVFDDIKTYLSKPPLLLPPMRVNYEILHFCIEFDNRKYVGPGR